MILIGLAGPAGAGKDSVADILVKTFGFIKFAFSDALYAEVRCAFGLDDESLLRDRATKEVPAAALELDRCSDQAFRQVVKQARPGIQSGAALSPREVLQLWGTEYRRAQDPNYWVKRAGDFILGLQRCYEYPEHVPQYYVECGARFENERMWIRSGGNLDGGQELFRGNIWHIHREGLNGVSAHASEQPLEVLPGERQLWNNDSLERLQRGVELMMTTPATFVRVDPMLLPDVDPA